MVGVSVDLNFPSIVVAFVAILRIRRIIAWLYIAKVLKRNGLVGVGLLASS